MGKNTNKRVCVRRLIRPAMKQLLERLESRVLLTGGIGASLNLEVGPFFATYQEASHLTPQAIRHAYGVDAIQFGGIAGDGAGQTIAIVVAYHHPYLLEDLQAFDATFGLPDPPSLTVKDQNGGNNLPGVDQTGRWALEEAMDVEWAHAMAPAANLVVFEANSDMIGQPDFLDPGSDVYDLYTAVAEAKTWPGVSVVSMSWGTQYGDAVEPSAEYEAKFDPIFTTPTGHGNVTFVAASGDTGLFESPTYPAISPNVVAVGGTVLASDSQTNGRLTEDGWWTQTDAGSGGGVSLHEGLPTYQQNLWYYANSLFGSSDNVYTQATMRVMPDVSMVAASSAGGEPDSAVPVYSDVGPSPPQPGPPWWGSGGTSLSVQLFAGLIAIANQGRALSGLGTLDSDAVHNFVYNGDQVNGIWTVGANTAFYDMIDEDSYHSQFTYPVEPGYDCVTGVGSPKANAMVGDLGILANGDFERGNLHGWTPSGNVANSTSSAFLGTYAAEFGSGATISQPIIGLTANTQYALWAAGQVDGGSGNITLTITTASGSTSSTFTGGNYTYQPTYFKTAAGETSATITLTSNIASGNHAYVDSVSIVENDQFPYSGDIAISGNATNITVTQGANSVTYNNPLLHPLTLNPGTGTHTITVTSGTASFLGGLEITGNGSYTVAVDDGAILELATPVTLPTITGNGTLAIYVDGVVTTPAVSVATLADSGTLTVNTSTAVDGPGTITGPGDLAVRGTGMLILGGNDTFTGNTTIGGGSILRLTHSLALGCSTLIYAAGGGTLTFDGSTTAVTLGALSGDGNLNLTNTSNNGVALTVGTNSRDTTFSGNLTGNAGLTKVGSAWKTGNTTSTVLGFSAMLTLTGNNSTLTGCVAFNGGVLNVGSPEAIGDSVTAGTISFNGGTLQYSSVNNTDYSPRFSTDPNQAYSIDMNGQTVTFSLGLTSASATLAKLGAGTLVLTGDGNYSGATHIQAGVLQIGDGGPTGAIDGGNIAIAAGAKLVVNRAGAITLPGVISGNGSVVVNGPGTLTLSGVNTYIGTTTIGDATVVIQNASALGQPTNPTSIIFSGNGTLRFAADSITLDYNHPVVIDDGVSASIDTGNFTCGIAGDLLGGGNDLGSASTLTKDGDGILTLSGPDMSSFKGATIIAAGTLILDSPYALYDSTLNYQVGGGTVSFGSQTTIWLGGLSGNRDLDLSNAQNGSVALTVGANGTDTTYSASLTGNGTLTKTGSGTFTLTGNNTYIGNTVVDLGVLQIGDGGNTGQIASGNVANGDTLAFDRSDATTFSGTIEGSGQVVQQGTGTLVLTGNNTYTGNTAVNAGELYIETDARIASSPQITVAANAILSLPPGQGITVQPVSDSVTLSISGKAVIRANNSTTNRTTVIQTLALAGSTNGWTGLIDLNNNNLIVTSSTFTDIANQIIQAAGAASPSNPWNGTGGITSTLAALAATGSTHTALGYATGAEFTALTGLTTFGGLPFNATDILIMYTLVGDANLDATVNLNDFFALSGHINQNGDWSQGDVNYTLTININDFFAMSGNFNKTLTAGN